MSAVHVECLCESECVRGKVDYMDAGAATMGLATMVVSLVCLSVEGGWCEGVDAGVP